MKYLFGRFCCIKNARFCWQEKTDNTEVIKNSAPAELMDPIDKGNFFMQKFLTETRQGQRKNEQGSYKKLNDEQKQTLHHLVGMFTPIIGVGLNRLPGEKSLEYSSLVNPISENFRWDDLQKIADSCQKFDEFVSLKKLIDYIQVVNKGETVHKTDETLNTKMEGVISVKDFESLDVPEIIADKVIPLQTMGFLPSDMSVTNFSLNTEYLSTVKTFDIKKAQNFHTQLQEHFPAIRTEGLEPKHLKRLKYDLDAIDPKTFLVQKKLFGSTPQTGNYKTFMKFVLSGQKVTQKIMDSPQEPFLWEGIDNLRKCGFDEVITATNYNEAMILFFADLDSDVMALVRGNPERSWDYNMAYNDDDPSIPSSRITRVESFYHLVKRITDQPKKYKKAFGEVQKNEDLRNNIFHPMMLVNDPDLIAWAVKNPKKFLAQQSIQTNEAKNYVLDASDLTQADSVWQIHRLLSEYNWTANQPVERMKDLLHSEAFLPVIQTQVKQFGDLHLFDLVDAMEATLELLDKKQLSNKRDVREVMQFVFETIRIESTKKIIPPNSWLMHMFESDFSQTGYSKFHDYWEIPDERRLFVAQESVDDKTDVVVGRYSNYDLWDKWRNTLLSLPKNKDFMNSDEPLILPFSVHGSPDSLNGADPVWFADQFVALHKNLQAEYPDEDKTILSRIKILTHSCAGADFMDEVLALVQQKIPEDNAFGLIYTTAQRQSYGKAYIKESGLPAEFESHNKSEIQDASMLSLKKGRDRRQTISKRSAFVEKFVKAEQEEAIVGKLDFGYINNPTWRTSVTQEMETRAKKTISNPKIRKKIKVGEMMLISAVRNQTNQAGSERDV